MGRRRRKVVGADLLELADPEHKAYRVENVALPAPVQARNGVELRVPTRHTHAVRVRLETIHNQLLDPHRDKGRTRGGDNAARVTVGLRLLIRLSTDSRVRGSRKAEKIRPKK